MKNFLIIILSFCIGWLVSIFIFGKPLFNHYLYDILLMIILGIIMFLSIKIGDYLFKVIESKRRKNK